MGGGSWTSQSWTSYSNQNVSNKSVNQVYTSRSMVDTHNPTLFTLRESRDSDDHPLSTPIIIGLDVTGSMDSILDTVAKKLGVLVGDIITRKPVTDPQIMFNAIGDLYCDNAPIQATQFESDIRIAEQLTELYFERGGGGNGSESYTLTWLLAARKTSIDSFEKRNEKGFIFTMGDDGVPPAITKTQAKELLNIDLEKDITTEEILSEVNKKYEVYHLCLRENSSNTPVMREWTKILGERAIRVTDYDKIPEIITSILELASGKDKNDVIKSWSGDTSIVVANAIGGLSVTAKAKNSLITF